MAKQVLESRHYVFLRDVFLIGLTAFGGPSAHMVMYLKTLVDKGRYVTEEDIIELNALCSILPGPTSTQVVTGIGFRLGGSKLAYLTLLLWALPAVVMMTVLGIVIANLEMVGFDLGFTKVIQPMAVGFIAYGALKITLKVIKTKTAVVIMVLSFVGSLLFGSPYAFPVIIVLGGCVTAVLGRADVVSQDKTFKIKWDNFLLWIGVLVVLAFLGFLTRRYELFSRLILLTENFYRNGSLIFGGGHVLIPLLLTEFSKVKGYLTEEEFRVGFGFVQALPGPLFSFSAYIGAMAMREYGLVGQIIGGFVSSFGIFMPGTFLIFFVIRIWNNLKKIRVIAASLEGINASASGMVAAATVLLFIPVGIEDGALNLVNIAVIAVTFCLLQFTKASPPIIIVLGLCLGFVI